MLQTTGEAAKAIAQRNAIRKLVGAIDMDNLFRRAQRAVANIIDKSQDPSKREEEISAIFDFFADLGYPQHMVLKALGVDSKEEINGVVYAKGIGFMEAAITDPAAVNEIFGHNKNDPEPQVVSAQERTDMLQTILDSLQNKQAKDFTNLAHSRGIDYVSVYEKFKTSEVSYAGELKKLLK
jgi:hypothetical protein